MIGCVLLAAMANLMPIESRLAAHDGHDPRACLMLGEDLMLHPQGRHHARHLLVLAVAHGDPGTVQSALWALHAQAEASEERVFVQSHLQAARSDRPSGFLPDSARPSEAVEDEMVVTVSDALGHLVAGEAALAGALLEDARVRQTARGYGVVFPEGVEAELKSREDRPALVDPYVHERVACLAVEGLPWWFLANGPDAVRHVSPRLPVTGYYRVDPALRWWRGGRWVDQP